MKPPAYTQPVSTDRPARRPGGLERMKRRQARIEARGSVGSTKHGTQGALRAHIAAGERPCDACEAVRTEYVEARKARQREASALRAPILEVSWPGELPADTAAAAETALQALAGALQTIRGL